MGGGLSPCPWVIECSLPLRHSCPFHGGGGALTFWSPLWFSGAKAMPWPRRVARSSCPPAWLVKTRSLESEQTQRLSLHRLSFIFIWLIYCICMSSSSSSLLLKHFLPIELLRGFTIKVRCYVCESYPGSLCCPINEHGFIQQYTVSVTVLGLFSVAVTKHPRVHHL